MQETTKKTSRLFFALYLGFFAGLIWGGLHFILQYIRFTRIPLPVFFRPPAVEPELPPFFGAFLGWAEFIALSVIASLIYVALFAKVRGPWLGVAYGLAWGTAACLLADAREGIALFDGNADWNSLSTEISVFVLWGLFIGYSAAFEFTDERQREPVAK